MENHFAQNPEIAIQTKETKKENFLLSAPDLIAPEKVSEELDSMTFRFSSDHGKYTLKQSSTRSAILVQCYDSLPNELTEEEKNKFTKVRNIIEGIERDVYILASKDFEELMEEESNKSKKFIIANPRDFQLDDSEIPNPAKIYFENLVETLKNKRIIFYTGAGISAGAGVHDLKSLRNNLQINESESCDGFLKIAASDPEKAVALWNEFTHVALNNKPTQAHIALTNLAKKLQCKIFTENVDHLHEKTGILAMRPNYDWLKKNVQEEWLSDIDAIITIGLNSDDRGFLAWYKENNPEGKIIAINLDQPKYLGDEDFLLKGDLQEIITKLDAEVSM